MLERVPVLVVDDEPHIGRIIRTRLEQGPFEVALAETGPAALAAMEARPDTRLLVLDLMLPGMSGLDVLRTLRADARFRDLPCLVLTAAGQDAQYRDAESLGVAEFMTKPFSPRRLYARVVALAGVSDADGGDGTEESA
jgi:DNA-binding response OmpR family regulator